MGGLTLKTEGETHMVMTRRFAASPQAVYQAHTDPEFVRQWCLGPDGWTMPICISEARPGGTIRYEWRNDEGQEFYLTGEYLELEPHRKIVHVERMFLPDPTPDNHIETRFEPDASGTLMTLRMTLPDAGARAAILAIGMEHGMEASYRRLDALFLPARNLDVLTAGAAGTTGGRATHRPLEKDAGRPTVGSRTARIAARH